jgi:hypothetical protein
MHVLQWIAVQVDNQLADPEQEAMQLVENKLQEEMGGQDQYLSWYDWFVIGGGRWNPDPSNQYQSSSNMIIHSKDKDKFDEAIAWTKEARMEEFAGYRESFEKKNIDLNAKLDSYKGNMEYDHELYALAKMIDMYQGKWDFNSYYFDIYHDSTNPKHMQDDLDLNPEMWYLVPVDFHF